MHYFVKHTDKKLSRFNGRIAHAKQQFKSRLSCTTEQDKIKLETVETTRLNTRLYYKRLRDDCIVSVVGHTTDVCDVISGAMAAGPVPVAAVVAVGT